MGTLHPVDYFIEVDNPAYSVNMTCDPYTGTCFMYYDVSYGPTPGNNVGAQLTSNYNGVGIQQNVTVQNPVGDGPLAVLVNYTVVDPTSHTHALLGDTTATNELHASDGSGYSAIFPTGSNLFEYPIANGWPTIANPGTAQVYDSSGVKYTAAPDGFSAVVTDPHNNQFTYSPTFYSPYITGPLPEVYDSIGRRLPTVQFPTSLSNQVQCPNLGYANQVPYASTTISFPGVNGTPQTYGLCYVSVPYHLGIVSAIAPYDQYAWDNMNAVYGNPELGYDLQPDTNYGTIPLNTVGSFTALQSVVLPDGNYWGFVYDASTVWYDNNWNGSSTEAYGVLTKLIYPQGGTATFDYGCDVSASSYSCNQNDVMAGMATGTVTTYYHSVASETRNDANGTSATTNYTYTIAPTPNNTPNGMTTTVTGPAPDNSVTKHYFYDLYGDGNLNNLYEAETDYYQGAASGTPLKRVTMGYQYQQRLVAAFGLNPFGGIENVLPTNVSTSYNGVTTSVQSMSYPAQWSVGEIICASWYANDAECGWVSPKNSNSISLNVSSATPSQVVISDGSENVLRTNVTTPEYMVNSTYKAMNMLDIPGQSQVFGAQNDLQAQTTYGYDAYGDQTSVSRWVNTTAGAVTTTTSYNSHGMPLQIIDPKNNVTNVNAYQCGAGLFPQSVTVPYGSTTTIPETTTYAYDCSTGKLTSVTDPNSVTTNFYYSDPPTVNGTPDPFGRLRWIDRAVGTSDRNTEKISYPSLTETDTAQDENTLWDGAVKSRNYYDGFGRVIHQERQIDQIHPSGSIVDTNYTVAGEVQSVSNPYWTTSDPTYGITSFAYDALGRKTSQTDSDGSSMQTWAYNGNQVTYADESSNHWQRTTDALGRLTQVLEPNGVTQSPTLETDYGYDALGNLLSVTQLGGVGSSGTRSRSFTYDSLSRLLTATNPENGTVGYSYDANGNVLTKTDARGITVTSLYDGMNRVTQKSASNNSFTYNYYYDWTAQNWTGMANSIGRLSYSTNNVNAATVNTYDPLGRTKKTWYWTPQISGWGTTVTPVYDLAGDVTSLTYPDGQTLAQTFDTATRLSTVNYASTNYLTAISYDPAGHLTSATMGNGAGISAGYNSRLEIGSLAYTSNSATVWSKQFTWLPTGNLYQEADMVSATTRQFSYDTLNRLKLAQGGGLYENYIYDDFGNLKQSGNFSFLPAAFNTANQPLPNTDWPYDAAGNLLADGLGNTFTWDANVMISSSNGTSYYYDAEGDRVGKSGTTPTDTVYFGGRPVARYASSAWTDLIYGAGGLLAEVPFNQSGAQVYRMTDHLGSSVGILSSTGALLGGIQDYAPFGQLNNGSSTNDPYKFTGKERDQESGNDYFGARYYASSMGRWMKPDPVGIFVADPSNPQSWNLYSYVLNNPLNSVDPDGLDCAWLSDDMSSIEEIDADSDTKPKDCTKSGGYYVPGRIVGYGTDSDNDISSLKYVPFSTDVTPTSPEPISSPFSLSNIEYTPMVLSRQQLQTVVSQNNLSGLSDNLVTCLAQSESGGNDQTVPLDNKGQYDRNGFPTAKGLMQVNNGAADYLAGGGKGSGAGISSLLFNPAFAVEAGSAYLGVLARKTGGAYQGVSAYKGGAVNQKSIDIVAACAGISKP
jgi:RHS repeat-associated protein